MIMIKEIACRISRSYSVKILLFMFIRMTVFWHAHGESHAWMPPHASGMNQKSEDRPGMNMIGFGEDPRMSDARNIVVDGRHVFVAGGTDNALTVFDVSDRSQPVYTTSISDSMAFVSDVKVKNGTAYILGRDSGSLITIDVGNPVKPVRLDGIKISGMIGANAIELHPSDPYAYISVGYTDKSDHQNSSLIVVEIADPSDIAVTSIISGLQITSGSNLYLQNEALYMAGDRDHSIMIFNLEDPSLPVLAGRFEDEQLHNPRGMSGNNEYLFVNSSGNKTIIALDVTSPFNPQKAGSVFHPFLTNTRQNSLAGNRLFVSSWQGCGVFLIDVSDPAEMRLIDGHFHRSLSGAFGITTDNRCVYATGTVTGGIVILEYH